MRTVEKDTSREFFALMSAMATYGWVPYDGGPMVLLPSDVNLYPFTPSRFILIVDGERITLEDWRMDRDYDRWLLLLERH